MVQHQVTSVHDANGLDCDHCFASATLLGTLEPPAQQEYHVHVQVSAFSCCAKCLEPVLDVITLLGTQICCTLS